MRGPVEKAVEAARAVQGWGGCMASQVPHAPIHPPASPLYCCSWLRLHFISAHECLTPSLPCSAMVPDAEVVAVLVEILSELRLGQFEVKLNHRGLLDAMLAIAGEG
mgnify:CR=1 FL=1